MKRIINFIKNSCFVKSFKELDKRLLWVIASEILLIISIFIVFLISSIFLKTSLNSLGISDEFMNNVNQLKNETFAMSFLKEQINTSPKKFESFLTNLGFNVIFSLLIITILICFFKSFEWSKIAKKRFTKLFFIKYLALFLIWNIFWLLLFFIIALKFKSYTIKYAIAIWFFSFIYFSLLIYPMFVKEKKIFNTIKKTFRLGHIYKLILPIINIWILLQLGYLILIISSKIPLLVGPIFILYFLFYISWIKFYLYKVVENVQEN